MHPEVLCFLNMNFDALILSKNLHLIRTEILRRRLGKKVTQAEMAAIFGMSLSGYKIWEMRSDFPRYAPVIIAYELRKWAGVIVDPEDLGAILLKDLYAAKTAEMG